MERQLSQFVLDELVQLEALICSKNSFRVITGAVFY